MVVKKLALFTITLAHNNDTAHLAPSYMYDLRRGVANSSVTFKGRAATSYFSSSDHLRPSSIICSAWQGHVFEFNYLVNSTIRPWSGLTIHDVLSRSFFSLLQTSTLNDLSSYDWLATILSRSFKPNRSHGTWSIH